MNQKVQQNNPDALRISQIFWGAYCFSTFLFGILLIIKIPTKMQIQEPILLTLTAKPLFIGFSIFALAALVLSRIIPAYLLRSHSAQKPPRNSLEAIRLFYVPFVIGMALLEVVVLVGFLISLISHNLQVYLVFALVTLVNQLIRFPREKAILNTFGLKRKID